MLLFLAFALLANCHIATFGHPNGIPSNNLRTLWLHLTHGGPPEIDPRKPWLEFAIRMPFTDCGRVMSNDKGYIAELASNRFAFQDHPDLPVDCASITMRNYFPTEPGSDEERDFPLAFTKAVYRDYLFLEMELASTYAPQNFYCFAIDSKADKLFKYQLRSLGDCFPNVWVLGADREFDMDSRGYNMGFAHLACMELLVLQGSEILKTPLTIDLTQELPREGPDQMKPWRYLITLQNHDIALKTNQEMVQIFKWLQGANSIQYMKVPKDRINWNRDWTLRGLNLIRLESSCLNYANHGDFALEFAKGIFQSGLSREFIAFILCRLDITKMLNQMQLDGLYGVDEQIYQTLSATEILHAPGGFTTGCSDKEIQVPALLRFTIWGHDTAAAGWAKYYGFAKGECYSNRWRHGVCIFGVEDLAPNMANSPFLFGNKMMPGFDFGAIACWHEVMFDRAYHDRGLHRLNADVYLQLPQVRYHVEKMKKGAVDLKNFDCKYKYKSSIKLF